jgi:ABC-type polysaccharide/polyol phosphate export permease
MIRILRDVLHFIQDLYAKKGLIFELTKRDYKNRYMGSVLGFFWSIAQPIIMMSIMWGVFRFGLKTGNIGDGVPFIVYFFVAYVAWIFFSDAVSFSTTVINEYSFLVKKIDFRLSILPIVKILSSLITHGFLMIFIVIVLIVNDFYPNVFWLQIFYCLFCTIALALGLGWVASAMNVFWKDIGYIVSVVLQFGFWLSPIFWDSSILSERIAPFVKINPVYYIVECYRGCLIYNDFILLSDLRGTIQFWIITLLVLFAGMIVFKRLRPHFADVI